MKSLVCVALVLLSVAQTIAGELQDAAGRGDLDKLRALIKSNPSTISAREGGTTALHEAARSGHLEAVKLLVFNGANVNATDFSGLTPLRLAVGRRQTAIAEFLRQNGGLEQAAPRVSAVVTNAAPATAAGQNQPGALFATNVASRPAA